MSSTIISDAEALVRKLESVFPLSDDERDAVLSVPMLVTEVKSRQDIVRAGDSPTRCCLVISGFAAVFKVTGDGDRQISAFKIAGDIPDLHSLHLDHMDSTIATLTACRLGFIRHSDVIALGRRAPRVSDALWRTILVDASVLREWLSNVGQRPAYARIAHLLCEILARLAAVGLSDGTSCVFPISQTDLAEATGMSSVHVNRTLQDLRKAGLIRLEDKRLVALDLDRLREAATFHPGYLHLAGSGDLAGRNRTSDP